MSKSLTPSGWVKRFRRSGFIVERGGAHWKVYAADRAGGVLITIPSTPSDWRWEKNLRAGIEKAGLSRALLYRANTDSSKLVLAERNSRQSEDVNMAKVQLADIGRTIAVRARFRLAVDEVNSLLPGHRGAFAHIARELTAFGRARNMQTWPTVGAANQMLMEFYKQKQAGFALWAVELIDTGLDSVGMPEAAAPGSNGAAPPVQEFPAPVPAIIRANVQPLQEGEDALEVFYRLVRGDMDVDAAYLVARAFRAGMRVLTKGDE